MESRVRILVFMLSGPFSDLTQLSSAQHDTQNSLVVGLLVGGLKADSVLPSPCSRHLSIGEVLLLWGPVKHPPMPLPISRDGAGFSGAALSEEMYGSGGQNGTSVWSPDPGSSEAILVS
jgi:hypothetical protein